MTEENIAIWKVLLILLGLTILFVLSAITIFKIFEYTEYYDYKQEGYVTRFSINMGCEIQIKNVNNKITWERCDNIGDTFTVKNFGVRSKK